MARSNVIQTNFLSGVLDPRAQARIESDTYNNALLTGENIELHHLGGGRRRRGTAFRAKLPNVLTLATATATAPNGGTVNNAKDDDTATLLTTTVAVGATNEYVVVHYDLGSALTVSYMDVLGIRTDAGSSTEFCIQWSEDDFSWNNTSPSLGSSKFEIIDTDPRDYRRTLTVAARYWRVVRIGTTVLAAHITIADFNIWIDSDVVSESRVLPFEVSSSQRVVLVVTDRSGTVVENGLVVDSIPLPYASADIPALDSDTSVGELVITHEDYQQRVVTEDTDDNYQSEALFFLNVPQVDFADDLSPVPVSEVQVVTLAGALAIGNTFQVTLDGAHSGAVVYAGDANADQQAATTANFRREIQKLYTVPGRTGVTVARTGALTYTVTFADASAKTYELMSITALTGPGTTSVARSAAGTARTEALWSATRGYPRTVAFYEKRLYFGGTRDRPSALIASHVIDTTDYDLAQGLADEAIYVELTGQRDNTIMSLLAHDAFMVYTAGGERRYLKRDGEPVTPGDVPKAQTSHGSRRIRPCVLDGVAVFVHQTGKVLRDFKYDVNVDKYDSLSLSALSSHLINDIRDIAAWGGSTEEELNLLFVVNGDGTMGVLNLKRQTDVRAWVHWDTQGLFKAVGVVLQDVYFTVQRTVAGVDGLYLEQLSYDYYTDCALKVVNSPARTYALGFTHMLGEELTVRADGYSLGTSTPTGLGVGTLPLYDGSLTFTNVEAGLPFVPVLTPMPLQTIMPAGSNFLDKRRIVQVKALVRNTLGLLVNGHEIPDLQFDTTNFDTPPVPLSRPIKIEDSQNWDYDGDKLVVFSQETPQPMEILGVKVKIASETD